MNSPVLPDSSRRDVIEGVTESVITECNAIGEPKSGAAPLSVNGVLLSWRSPDIEYPWRTPQDFRARIREDKLDDGRVRDVVTIIPPAINAPVRVIYGKAKEPADDDSLRLWVLVLMQIASWAMWMVKL